MKEIVDLSPETLRVVGEEARRDWTREKSRLIWSWLKLSAQVADGLIPPEASKAVAQEFRAHMAMKDLP